MQTQSLFPTVIARIMMADATDLNAELYQCLQHWKATQAGAPSTAPEAWKVKNGWEIGPSFFRQLREHACVNRLQRVIEPHFLEFINCHHLRTDFDPPRVTSACAIDSSWATVLEENAFLADEHIHHGTHFVGVYYVQVPACIDGRDDRAGYLLLRDPRPGMHVSRLSGQKTVELVRPQEGLLLLFPGYLSHAVRPFWGPGERISINCNLRVTDLLLAPNTDPLTLR